MSCVYNTNRQRTLEMSQDVASKQPLISTALEVKPAAEDQNQQRKCGVHRLQVCWSHSIPIQRQLIYVKLSLISKIVWINIHIAVREVVRI